MSRERKSHLNLRHLYGHSSLSNTIFQLTEREAYLLLFSTGRPALCLYPSHPALSSPNRQNVFSTLRQGFRIQPPIAEELQRNQEATGSTYPGEAFRQNRKTYPSRTCSATEQDGCCCASCTRSRFRESASRFTLAPEPQHPPYLSRLQARPSSVHRGERRHHLCKLWPRSCRATDQYGI